MKSLLSSPQKRLSQWFAITGTAVLTLLMAAGAPAGIQGSGFRAVVAIGTITSVGTGSISVGGTSYSTGGASVDIDGKSGAQGELQVGDVVALSGSDESGQAAAVANHITFSGNVRGPVSSIDTIGGSFVVLGQTIRTNSQTIFSGPLKVTALAGVLLGDVVEVSGFDNADGEIVASRIDLKAANGQLRVTGSVRSINSSQSTFSINSLVVDFGRARVQGTLVDGTSVAVQASALASTGVLLATAVDVQSPVAAEPGADGRIEGIITELSSTTYFEVNGLPVSINSQTKINPNVRLSLNAPVQVTGHFDSNGVLVAEHVQAAASEAKTMSKGSQ